MQITIEYNDRYEVTQILRKISGDLKKMQTNHKREQFGQAVYEWGISNTNLEEGRIEVINGQQCMVFKSKM